MWCVFVSLYRRNCDCELRCYLFVMIMNFVSHVILFVYYTFAIRCYYFLVLSLLWGFEAAIFQGVGFVLVVVSFVIVCVGFDDFVHFVDDLGLRVVGWSCFVFLICDAVCSRDFGVLFRVWVLVWFLGGFDLVGWVGCFLVWFVACLVKVVSGL